MWFYFIDLLLSIIPSTQMYPIFLSGPVTDDLYKKKIWASSTFFLYLSS